MKILYIFFSIVMHYIATVKCHLSEMKQIISTKSVKLWLQLASDFYLLTTLIMEPTMVIQKNLPDCDNNFLMSIEICARKLCYALHCGRSYLINSETATRQCNWFYLFVELFTFYCDLNILYRSSGAPTNWWIIPTQEKKKLHFQCMFFSETGVAANPDKVKWIQEWSVPNRYVTQWR